MRTLSRVRTMSLATTTVLLAACAPFSPDPRNASTPPPAPIPTRPPAASTPDPGVMPPGATPAPTPPAGQPPGYPPVPQPHPPPAPITPAAVCGSGDTRLGPPTAAELAQITEQAKAAPYLPSGTNKGNNFAYGTGGKALGNMRSLYALTGDIWFLDYAIQIADYMLSVRNDETTGRVLWTGKREPCWPNNADDAPDAGVCGAESGAVANQLLSVTRIVVGNKALWDRTVGGGDPHGYGATYMQRARTYLREASRTMEYFLAHFIDREKGNRIVTPTDPAYAALGPSYVKAQGRNMAWNQQDMITGPLASIGDILLALGEEPERVAANDVIVRASMDAFIDELQTNKYTVNGVTVYKWGYNPGDLFHVEDTAHSSGDINALYNAYRRGRYGVAREVMVGIANTFLEVIVRPDWTYAEHVDAMKGGTRPTISSSWMNYEEFRAGIVARLAPKLTVDASTPLAEAITILAQRNRLCR